MKKRRPPPGKGEPNVLPCGGVRTLGAVGATAQYRMHDESCEGDGHASFGVGGTGAGPGRLGSGRRVRVAVVRTWSGPPVGECGDWPISDIDDGRDRHEHVDASARRVPVQGSGKRVVVVPRDTSGAGPIEPGTVVVRPNGCWEFRIDFNSFHDQTWERCRTNSKLVESGGRTDQRFDFVTFKMSEHSTVTCDPPIVEADANDKPGTTSRVHCTGRSQTTKTTFAQTGVSTFVGREAVLVGGVSIPGLHTREDMLLSGGQTGVVRVDIWFAASDGLPLKEVHSIKVVSPAPTPLNHVTYTEVGGWQLTSMTPRT